MNQCDRILTSHSELLRGQALDLELLSVDWSNTPDTPSVWVPSTVWWVTVGPSTGPDACRLTYFWGGGFWEDSYYIGTAGEVSSQTIEQSIERTEHV
ncbi:MAG: hypothetical protein J07HQW2_03334 [Haloquadratum walsbyi J07HQW2]|jgi:hypothetical protein|uniref:Uncharacterized protein n=1 Tax=Haloquadratum walsbyi J07HQW2 TaxID=1238425 RepID=U1NI51_9EURY|nr:MAG: hypothetical protein J07HQW2_03334 [Haloquadratum walsbyi J07HQW2]